MCLRTSPPHDSPCANVCNACPFATLRDQSDSWASPLPTHGPLSLPPQGLSSLIAIAVSSLTSSLPGLTLHRAGPLVTTLLASASGPPSSGTTLTAWQLYQPLWEALLLPVARGSPGFCVEGALENAEQAESYHMPQNTTATQAGRVAAENSARAARRLATQVC